MEQTQTCIVFINNVDYRRTGLTPDSTHLRPKYSKSHLLLVQTIIIIYTYFKGNLGCCWQENKQGQEAFYFH
jgi:hypothetical protein